MQLDGYEGKRFYVNALTGWEIGVSSSASSSRGPGVSYSVHDRFYGGREVARFYAPCGYASRPTGSQRHVAALTCAAALNAEHDALQAREGTVS